jgi:hypothetical protein
MISGERNGIRQQFVSHQTTGYIDLLSLAQLRRPGHQEYKLQLKMFIPCFPE